MRLDEMFSQKVRQGIQNLPDLAAAKDQIHHQVIPAMAGGCFGFYVALAMEIIPGGSDSVFIMGQQAIDPFTPQREIDLIIRQLADETFARQQEEKAKVAQAVAVAGGPVNGDKRSGGGLILP